MKEMVCNGNRFWMKQRKNEDGAGLGIDGTLQVRWKCSCMLELWMMEWIGYG